MPTSTDRSEIIHPMLPDQIQKTSAPVLSGRIFQGLLGLVGLIDDKTDILLSDILWKAGNIYRTAKEIVFFPETLKSADHSCLTPGMCHSLLEVVTCLIHTEVDRIHQLL